MPESSQAICEPSAWIASASTDELAGPYEAESAPSRMTWTSGADEDLPNARERARLSLLGLHESYKRLRHPAVFPVGIAPALAQLKASIIAQIC